MCVYAPRRSLHKVGHFHTCYKAVLFAIILSYVYFLCWLHHLKLHDLSDIDALTFSYVCAMCKVPRLNKHHAEYM